MRWNAIIADYDLERNEYLANRYQIRSSWISAFFMNISLTGVLRITSRSKKLKFIPQSLYPPKIMCTTG
jgi:hypothetical protein